MNCDPFEPHVESFNYFLGEGLRHAVLDIAPEEFQHPDGGIVELKYAGATISSPSIARSEESKAKSLLLYPVECRQRGITYSGKLKCSYTIDVNGRCIAEFDRVLADIPIMVMSNLCNLHGMTETQLVNKCEEATEKGGFFIVKGLDKLIRLLIGLRQNYPLALIRDRWRQHGPYFSEYGIMIRCVKGNHSSVMHNIHYVETRRLVFRMVYMKQLFLIPVGYLLRALTDKPDNEIHEALTRGRRIDDGWRRCIENVMRDVKNQKVFTQDQALRHLGSIFRVALSCQDFVSDAEVGRRFIKRCFLIHLDKNEDKLNFFIYMIRKLAALVNGECKDENPDSTMLHEAILPGHVMLMILKEKLKVVLRKVRFYMWEQLEKLGHGAGFSKDIVERAFKKAPGKEVGRAFDYFLATGNLVSNGEIVLPQSNGFSVIAERINHFRYVSHFRGIHRGAVFQDMRTTDIRKLRPEAWGFICPVHTPDGAPCGLLNHLTASCRVTCTDGPLNGVFSILHQFGFLDLDEFDLDSEESFSYPVLINGALVGYLDLDNAESCVDAFRKAKTAGRDDVSPFTEVVLVPKKEFRNLYPSLWIFTNGARMVRPVWNLGITGEDGKPVVEYVGTFEQVYLNIAVVAEEIEKGMTTHHEISPSAMFSYIANLIPYPDHNQSPRNVYQCQMSKQTMGWNAHALPFRTDNKLYRVQTPQSALVKTDSYDRYNIDDYPLGTNAIVAVIAYTGYDMEDGMVINKSSYERGFAMGCVYKSERVDLQQIRGSKPGQYVFARDPKLKDLENFLDPDGLPYVGRKYVDGNPLYCYLDVDSGEYKIKRYHGSEVCHVENVKICGADNGEELLNHIVLMLRATRKPNIGDKFASRHGQKGICSFLWPSQNMPFTETGIVPDIIFNPHGFPSRMTVGMMLESMAGKSAASQGIKHDATPFVFSEDFPAVDYFGECLQRAGFNYYGTEPMYSGVDGREFEAQIFFGVVYYQRLRHMVADKFQMRATGSMDPVTRQPVKGRKRGGGVRFGEMERDSLISHGVSMILHDRLYSSSDRDTAHICSKCGDYLSVMFQVPDVGKTRPVKDEPLDPVENLKSEEEFGEDAVKEEIDEDDALQYGRIWYCRVCKTSRHVRVVTLPHVFKFLIAELACVNVKVNFHLEGGGTP